MQQFFARFLGKELFRMANRERGRFRTFLLTGMKNFLANEWEKARAQKRGGRSPAVSIDAETETGGRPLIELSDERTAEHAYENNWALALLAQARERLAAEFSADREEDRFRCLEQFLPGEASAMTYAEAGMKLGVPEGTLKSEVHRLKRRYRDLLREEIGRTVATPSELDDELRHLMAILSRPNH